MRLDKKLVERNLAPTRSKAQELINSEKVEVNGKVITKLSFDVGENDKINIKQNDLLNLLGNLNFQNSGNLKAFLDSLEDLGIDWNSIHTTANDAAEALKYLTNSIHFSIKILYS